MCARIVKCRPRKHEHTHRIHTQNTKARFSAKRKSSGTTTLTQLALAYTVRASRRRSRARAARKLFGKRAIAICVDVDAPFIVVCAMPPRCDVMGFSLAETTFASGSLKVAPCHHQSAYFCQESLENSVIRKTHRLCVFVCVLCVSVRKVIWKSVIRKKRQLPQIVENEVKENNV